ncbi:NUDIX domain-containing protein [Kitasatospora sp. HPMI-4]|uniref:NUDIX domain-containing protein n=1 Tax=Kitasatospora sp. HPMI-4 TaxID=3448443 RepID=UPI003F1DD6ED
MPPEHAEEMRAVVRGVTTVSDDWFRLRRYAVDLRRSDGRLQRLDRLCVESGDRAAVLLHNPAEGTVLLTEQFRISALLAGDARGSSVEAPGGLLGGESAREAARREVEEETGYRVGRLEHLLTVCLSPQLGPDRTHLFIGEYAPGDRTGRGGGIAEEGEDIALLELPLEDALELVLRQPLTDAKTVLLLLLARDRLARP